jgi:hypothetical protein
MVKNIKFNLLDNGIDYIYMGVKPMLKKSPKSRNSWKYSVLHLYSGIQLLLKERLKQEDWTLIFKDPDEANREKLESGIFPSVGYKELIKRLRKKIPNFNINNEPIENLQKLRNKTEHFEINISLVECQMILALALDEIISFWKNYLENNSTITIKQKQRFQKIKSIATEFDAYRKQRLDKFKKEIDKIESKKNGLRVLCPDCSSFSFIVFKNDVEECQCFVCDVKYNKHDYFRKIREVEGNELYDKTCSSCQQETIIKYEIKDEVNLYCCLNCLKNELKDIPFEKENSPYMQLTWEDIFTDIKHNGTYEDYYQIRLNRQRQKYLGKE